LEGEFGFGDVSGLGEVVGALAAILLLSSE
jgi:hypothetical protein